MKPQIMNAKEWPSVYSCKFIEPGVVSYEDSDCGIALVKKETIDLMLPSFIGRPVCIDHHQITPENYEELKKNGIIIGNVIDVWFNPQDGWFWAKFIVETEEARKCIEEKEYSVSCAYNVKSVQGGGLWHDIKYDGEITDGSFTHLALVEQPRYEDSKIIKQLPAMLVNGKSGRYVDINKKQEAKFMDFNFKFWEKKENSKEKTAEIANLHVELSNGKNISLGEILNAVEKAGLFNDKDTSKPTTVMCAKGDIVDIEGHTYPINDLMNAYTKMNSAESEEDKAKREKEEMEAKNAKEEEEKKKMEEEKVKENAKKVKEAEELANGKKHFDELNNARGTNEEDGQPTVPLTRAERAQRWHEKNKKK